MNQRHPKLRDDSIAKEPLIGHSHTSPPAWIPITTNQRLFLTLALSDMPAEHDNDTHPGKFLNTSVWARDINATMSRLISRKDMII